MLQVRDMIESVQTNYNANVDKINFVFEELIQGPSNCFVPDIGLHILRLFTVLRQRQNFLIGEVSRIRDEKLKVCFKAMSQSITKTHHCITFQALHAQSKQLTNYLTDLHYSADAADHMIRHGSEWEVPLTNKVFYDLQVSEIWAIAPFKFDNSYQVDFNPLTRLPQRTHDDTSVRLIIFTGCKLTVALGKICRRSDFESKSIWRDYCRPYRQYEWQRRCCVLGEGLCLETSEVNNIQAHRHYLIAKTDLAPLSISHRS